MSAKVDNSALQDGFQLYHHSFFVSEDGKWSVIQQGMNPEIHYARRYHWLSEKVKSFVVEPHLAICCDTKGKVLNMVAKESEECRKSSVDLIKDNPNNLKKYLLLDKKHDINLKNFRGLNNAYEFQPKNYEQLILVKGMGPKSIRALALLSKLIYGKEPIQIPLIEEEVKKVKEKIVEEVPQLSKEDRKKLAELNEKVQAFLSYN